MKQPGDDAKTDFYCKKQEEKIFFSLENGFNLMIEGNPEIEKTPSALCSILKWQKNKIKKENKQESQFYLTDKTAKDYPRIFYLTKTQKQIENVISQLKQTEYSPSSTIIGSKRQFCSNQPNCVLCNNTKKHQIETNKMLNMKEIKELAQNRLLCPYFVTRSLLIDAKMVFMPYGYILNHRGRDSLGMSFSKSIVVIDEAQDLEDVCCENSSYEITTETLKKCLFIIKENEFAAHQQAILLLQKMFFKIIAEIKKIRFNSKRYVLDGEWTLKMLSSSNISFKNISTVFDVIDCVICSLDHENRQALFLFRSFLQTVFLYEQDSHLKYKTVIFDLKHGERSVFYVCNDSSVTMKSLKKLDFHSIVTLNSHTKLFPSVRLGNSFLYSKEAAFLEPKMFVINEDFKSTAVDREKACYQTKVGETVVKISNRTDRSIAVFFQSKRMLEVLTTSWKKSSLWKEIKNKKDVCFNRPEKAYQNRTIHFCSMTQHNRSANIVVVVGIPFGSFNEHTKAVIDIRNKKRNDSGNDWYLRKAVLTVAQAVTSAVNKRTATVFLCDKRYLEKRIINRFPEWMRKNKEIIKNKSLDSITLN